jgi:hypothetical protein
VPPEHRNEREKSSKEAFYQNNADLGPEETEQAWPWPMVCSTHLRKRRGGKENEGKQDDIHFPFLHLPSSFETNSALVMALRHYAEA